MTQKTKGQTLAAAISDFIDAHDYRYSERDRRLKRSFEQLAQVLDDTLRADGEPLNTKEG